MSEDIVGQIKDIKGRTWQEAFYIQTKAFLEKNSEHLKEIARLKAEVDRLTAFTTRTIIPNEELKAQVERLTKAGDNMYSWLGVCGRHNNSTGDDWLRAKKGLPSLSEQWEIEKRNRAAEDAAKMFNSMMGVVAPCVVPPCIDRYTAKEGKQP